VAHDHAHAHSHSISADADRAKLRAALALILALMAVEVVVGIAVSSLALLSDAAHMLTDAAALALALLAIRLAKRPAAGSMTFGWQRAEILSAQFNGATLLVLGLVIVFEGVHRLVEPPDVGGAAVLIVAIAGIAINLVATWLLSQANRESLNVEGAFRHILTDLVAFVCTAIAGAVILLTGFDRADGIASLVIAASMIWASYGLLRESGRIFLEAAPRGLDPERIGRALASHSGVYEIHDLHVWEVSSGFPALSAHVVVDDGADCHMIRLELEHELHDRFGLDHTTLQVDHRHEEELLQVEVPGEGESVRPEG
jgi:cobalt-zinc-cadmium efflux system protein